MENSAQWKKLSLAAQSGTGFIFYLLRRHAMNHSLIWKYISLHPPGYMRRTWHWTEAGYNENNCYIIQQTIYLCIFDTSKYIIWNRQVASPHLGTDQRLTDDNRGLDCWTSLGSKEQPKTCRGEDLLPEKVWRRWPIRRWLKKCLRNRMPRAQETQISLAPPHEDVLQSFWWLNNWSCKLLNWESAKSLAEEMRRVYRASPKKWQREKS